MVLRGTKRARDTKYRETGGGLQQYMDENRHVFTIKHTWMPCAATAVVFPKLDTNVTFHRRVMFAASCRLGKSNCCHAFFFGECCCVRTWRLVAFYTTTTTEMTVTAGGAAGGAGDIERNAR